MPNMKRLNRLDAMLTYLIENPNTCTPSGRDFPGASVSQFDMSYWVSPCGTSACAAGWATLERGFNRLGYTVEYRGTPIFNGIAGWGAIRRFFDLTGIESWKLFRADSYVYLEEVIKDFGAITPLQVRDRLRDMFGTRPIVTEPIQFT